MTPEFMLIQYLQEIAQASILTSTAICIFTSFAFFFHYPYLLSARYLHFSHRPYEAKKMRPHSFCPLGASRLVQAVWSTTRLGVRRYATASHEGFVDSFSRPTFARAPHSGYWRRIPIWEAVSENEFIDYNWQVDRAGAKAPSQTL